MKGQNPKHQEQPTLAACHLQEIEQKIREGVIDQPRQPVNFPQEKETREMLERRKKARAKLKTFL
jgi:hypothetical protein